MEEKRKTDMPKVAAYMRLSREDGDEGESESITKRIKVPRILDGVEEFQAAPGGLSIEERVRRVLTKEEWEREYGC